MAVRPHLSRPAKSPSRRGKVPLTKSALRSAISNGTVLLSPQIDQRGPLVRRLKDLINDHVADLGGMDHISHSERMLVSKAAMIMLLTETIETHFILSDMNVKPSTLANYVKTIGALRRVLQTLGLHRRAKLVPSLKDYIENYPRDDDVEEAEIIE